MAAINQITIAGGSTYDVNDKRITTSAVSTATHFLATDSSISSIAPITAANLASVLGGELLGIGKVTIQANSTQRIRGYAGILMLGAADGTGGFFVISWVKGVSGYTKISGMGEILPATVTKDQWSLDITIAANAVAISAKWIFLDVYSPDV